MPYFENGKNLNLKIVDGTKNDSYNFFGTTPTGMEAMSTNLEDSFTLNVKGKNDCTTSFGCKQGFLKNLILYDKTEKKSYSILDLLWLQDNKSTTLYKTGRKPTSYFLHNQRLYYGITTEHDYSIGIDMPCHLYIASGTKYNKDYTLKAQYHTGGVDYYNVINAQVKCFDVEPTDSTLPLKTIDFLGGGSSLSTTEPVTVDWQNIWSYVIDNDLKTAGFTYYNNSDTYVDISKGTRYITVQCSNNKIEYTPSRNGDKFSVSGSINNSTSGGVLVEYTFNQDIPVLANLPKFKFYFNTSTFKFNRNYSSSVPKWVNSTDGNEWKLTETSINFEENHFWGNAGCIEADGSGNFHTITGKFFGMDFYYKDDDGTILSLQDAWAKGKIKYFTNIPRNKLILRFKVKASGYLPSDNARNWNIWFDLHVIT